MKKKFTKTLIAGAVAASLFLLGGCSLFEGYFPDSNFPSDVAESRGDDGSVASWLASLDTPSSQYRRMYEEAVADGSFSGTFFEFLKELGVDDADGAYVQSALRSVVSIQCAFDGKGTEADFMSMGSGVIYSLDEAEGDAYIVTNYHVVYSSKSSGKEKVPHISDTIEVYLYGAEIEGREMAASYVGGAMNYDIAVLRLDNCEALKEGNAAEVVGADSDSLTLGQPVYAVGNADAKGISVTEGVVSVDCEYVEFYAANDSDVIRLPEIRTDAAVNHGNSGGGLFNSSGELVGIVNGRMETEDTTGFGYAIPANLALSLAQNILDTCGKASALRGGALARLGITAQESDSHGVFDETTGKYYIEEKIVAQEVDYRGAADRAGIRAQDTIVSVHLISTRNGAPYERTVEVTRLFRLTNFLFEVRLGDTVEFTLSRDGETVVLPVTFGEVTDFLILS